MQYQHIGYGVKGFYRVGCYAIKPTMNNEIIQHRLRVLEFWEKHGLQAATDHSGKSRRALFNWKKQYHVLGVSGLQAKSTAPKHRRKRQWSVELIQQIRHWRTELPNLGKSNHMSCSSHGVSKKACIAPVNPQSDALLPMRPITCAPAHLP